MESAMAVESKGGEHRFHYHSDLLAEPAPALPVQFRCSSPLTLAEPESWPADTQGSRLCGWTAVALFSGGVMAARYLFL